MTSADVEFLRLAVSNPALLKGRIALVEAALHHRRCFVRRLAVQGLITVRPRGLRRQLIEALADRCWEVRVAAAEGLAVTSRLRRSPPELMVLLRDRSKLVRVQAVETVGMIGDRRARPSIRAMLGDRSALVRRYAGEALGRIGNEQDRPLLEKQFRRERSASAKLGLAHGAYLLGAPWALTELLSNLSSDDYIIRSATAVALEDTRGRPSDRRLARAALEAALKQERTVAKDYLRQALDTLAG